MYKYFIIFFVVQMLNISTGWASSSQNVEVEADVIHYDKKANVTIAEGNVIVISGKRKLVSEELHYHKDKGVIFAKKDIVIINDDGSQFFADKAELDQLLTSGKAINFKARFKENSLFAANTAEIIKKGLIRMKGIVFSPCKVCKTNFIPYVPTWQVRASSATLDQDKESVNYKNARAEFLGVPILYWPYLTTPAPNAKRKSGFLMPKISNRLGTTVAIPYYLNISPNKDMLVKSIISKDLGHIGYANYRHLLPWGEYNIEGSYTEPKKQINVTGYMPQKWRGHLYSAGEFNVGEGVLASYKIHRIHDKNRTYLKKYDFGHQDVLENDFELFYRKNNNQFHVHNLYFQDLREEKKKSQTPLILPYIQTEHSVKYRDVVFGINTDFSNLYRKEGTNYNRAIANITTDYSGILPFGQQIDVSGKLEVSAYHVEQKPILQNGNLVYQNTNLDGDVVKVYPSLRTTWHYPLYHEPSDVIFEPIIDFISNFNKKRSKIVPNEDSQGFELSATKLFDDNRYFGLDRAEIDNRINYGVLANLHNKYINDVSLLLGQTYRFSQRTELDNSSGIYNNSSDIVTGVYMQPLDNLMLLQQMRLGYKDIKLLRNELTIAYRPNKGHVDISYMGADKSVFLENVAYKRQINMEAGYNIYPNWWADIYVKTKLGRKKTNQSRMLEEGIKFKYSGECIDAEFKVGREYTKLKDLRPVTSWSFNVTPTF